MVYGFSTGFLQFRDDVLAKGSQEPVRLPYGYRMVHVRVRMVHIKCAKSVNSFKYNMKRFLLNAPI